MGNLVAAWCARSPFLFEQWCHRLLQHRSHHQQWQMKVSLSRSKIILKSFLKHCLSSSHDKFKSFPNWMSCLQPTLGRQYLHWYIENSIQRRANTHRIPTQYWFYLVQVIPLLWNGLHLFLQSPDVFRWILQVPAGRRHVLQLLL